MENKYTLEDIGSFIVDYRIAQWHNPDSWIINIPIIGIRMYEKTLHKNLRCEKFERAYFKALQLTPEEQENYIEKMTPVLDKFYSDKMNNALLGKVKLISKNTNKR